jgi:LCP family protein required for cell wall assembly
MDRLRIKRPGIQKTSQITKNAFANSAPVVKDNSKHTQNELQSTTPRTALLARRMPIDMSLPGESSPSRIEVYIRQAKWRRVRVVATRSAAVMVILTMTLGGLLMSQNYIKLHKVFSGSAPTADALKPNQSADLLRGQDSGRVNVLLLGRDGTTTKNPDVTNTIILASIDTVNNTATFISVPSNLWVNVPGLGVMKISAAWQAGEDKYLGSDATGSTNTKALEAGYKMVDSSVSQVLGLNVNYNLLVNMQALSQLVNTVGGVNVNVPSTLTDPTMAWENENNDVIVQQGSQNLTGKQALLYVMSKETTSDFSRDQRQRQVLTALFTKMTSLSTYANPVELDSLIKTFGNNLNSDLSLHDAAKLSVIANSVSSSNITSLDLTSSPNHYIVTGNVDGESVDLPAAGLFSYSPIKSYLSKQLKSPYIVKENAKILVLNGTDSAGLATILSEKLRNQDYNVLGAANAPTSNWQNTTLIQLNKNDKYTDASLEKEFKVKSINKLPNKSIPTDGADFVIIIGNNEANTSQT